MPSPRLPILGLVTRFASRLRFPQLFTAVFVLFLLDLVVPDMIPFVDEILLGLMTVLLGSMKHGGEDEPAAGATGRVEKDVTPRR